jgi:hypothetical protein
VFVPREHHVQQDTPAGAVLFAPLAGNVELADSGFQTDTRETHNWFN